MAPRSKPFTAEEDRVLMERKSQGQTFREIGQVLNRATGPVEYRYWTLADPHRVVEKTGTRSCLRCQQKFYSTHIGNRVCKKCNHSIDGLRSGLG